MNSCTYLKTIRKNLDDSIDTTSCPFENSCRGTCPKCESELEKINKRFSHKELVAMLGLATLGLTGCQVPIEETIQETTVESETEKEIIDYQLAGDIVYEP